MEFSWSEYVIGDNLSRFRWIPQCAHTRAGQHAGQSVCLDCGELMEVSAPTPAFTSFTASGLWCLTCGENVSFRTLTQFDGTEVYLCDTCDTEVGQKRATAPASHNGTQAPNDVPPAAQPSSGETQTPQPEPVKPPEDARARVGDWVLPLTADGAIFPHKEFPLPYLISKIEPGADGQLYAQFMESGHYWPLAQCERTDPPRHRPT